MPMVSESQSNFVGRLESLRGVIVQNWLGTDIVQRWPAPTMGLTAIISIAISISTAWFLYRSIELPSASFARRLMEPKARLRTANQP